MKIQGTTGSVTLPLEIGLCTVEEFAEGLTITGRNDKAVVITFGDFLGTGLCVKEAYDDLLSKTGNRKSKASANDEMF